MDFDFDELLADAEQEADMYEDEMDDIEAELAMQAEVSLQSRVLRTDEPRPYHAMCAHLFRASPFPMVQ